MNKFEMIVKDVFYLADGRMVFSGKFVSSCGVHLPMEVSIYVNEKIIGMIQLTTLPFSSGKSVKKDIDVIEASNQTDLKFVNWEKDVVMLKENY